MATATVDYWEVQNTTMTGSEVTYTFHAEHTSTLFKALSSDTTITHVSGGDTFTIALGETYEVTNKNLRGHTVFLTGTNTHIVQTIVGKGTEN